MYFASLAAHSVGRLLSTYLFDPVSPVKAFLLRKRHNNKEEKAQAKSVTTRTSCVAVDVREAQASDKRDKEIILSAIGHRADDEVNKMPTNMISAQ
jgi:hypothetical protein